MVVPESGCPVQVEHKARLSAETAHGEQLEAQIAAAEVGTMTFDNWLGLLMFWCRSLVLPLDSYASMLHSLHVYSWSMSRLYCISQAAQGMRCCKQSQLWQLKEG